MKPVLPTLLSLLVVLGHPLVGVQGCEETDSDGDGVSVEAGDCDDASATTYPGAPELCDRVDNDCDGVVDENAPCLDACSLTGRWLQPDTATLDLTELESGVVDGYAFWQDIVYSMVEGFHDPGTSPTVDLWLGCISEGCASVIRVVGDFGASCDELVSSTDPTRVLAIRMSPDGDSDGWTVEQGDCNDSDGSVYPKAIEFCDDVDNDCDGIVDEACITEVCSISGTWVGHGYTWILSAPAEGGAIGGTISDSTCTYEVHSSSYDPDASPSIHLAAYSAACNLGLVFDADFVAGCDAIVTDYGWELVRL